MIDRKLKIVINNHKNVKVDYNSKLIDILNSNDEDLSDVLAVRINNEVKSLNTQLFKNSSVEYIHFDDEDGYRIYSRTLKFILYMALTKLYGKLDVNFISTINKDQFFVINDLELTEEIIDKIKSKMVEIVNQNLEIVKRNVSTEEAEVLYTESKDEAKLDNLNNKIKSYMTMYFCDGLYNYLYGMLAPSTGLIKSFDLIRYKDGALLVIPDSIEEGMNFKKQIKDTRLYNTFIDFNEFNKIFGVENVGNLNNAVLTGKINGIIQSSESIHQRRIVEIVQDIEKRGTTKMILIAGPSSSGKTTFAQKLGVGLTLIGYNPITISMDNYFKERKDTPLGEDGKYDFERVDAIDIDLFNKHMNALINGEEVELPEFDFIEGKKEYKGNYLKLKENDILVLEGIHALNPILTQFTTDDTKYKIYIAPIATLNIDDYTKVSSTDIRMLRRMVRDFVTRGHSVEKTFELWGNVKKGESKYIFPYVDTVDTIFNSSLVYEAGIIKTFAQPLLLQVDTTSKYYSEARRLYEFLNNFLPIETSAVPIDSIVREFIGNGCFYR